MSHFVVMVIGDDIEGQMAPYQENNMGDCPEEYLEFEDCTKEVLEGWENDTTPRVRFPDGTSLSKYNDRFYTFNTKTMKRDFHLPEGAKLVALPIKEVYSSLEEYAENYHGFSPSDEDPKKFGYTHNPNSKWDWYVVGGRWNGYLPLKPGAFKPSNANQARLCDIDFERGRDERELEARKEFANWRKVFEKYGRPASITAVCDRYSSEDVDKAREVYNKQPAIRACTEDFFFSCPVETLGFDEEAYVQRERDKVLVPFAVVKDGKWYEKGSMGWWGVVSNKKDQANWNTQFQQLMNDLPPDTIVTMLDCHI